MKPDGDGVGETQRKDVLDVGLFGNAVLLGELVKVLVKEFLYRRLSLAGPAHRELPGVDDNGVLRIVGDDLALASVVEVVHGAFRITAPIIWPPPSRRLCTGWNTGPAKA
jgi:hypothetical protein